MTKARDIADNAGQGGGGNKNLVINGAMQVAQRGTSSTGLGASSGYFTVDRFNPNFNATAGRLTMTQEAITDLDGFTKCIKYACTTADTSIGASEYFIQTHAIEGQNLQHINKGTASAKKLTLSFYVKGNAAATYVCELQDGNSREIAQTFSVTTSWNRVVLTFDGDTDSGGTIANSNATGLAINLWLHGGSTFNSGNVADLNTSWSAAGSGGVRAAGADSFFDSTSRTFFITGMQLEVGDKATDFEHENYGTTLSKCERYHQRFVSAGVYPYFTTGRNHTSTVSIFTLHYRTEMRSNPSMSISDAADIRIYDGNDRTMTGFQINGNSTTTCGINFTGLSSGVGNNYAAQAYFLDNVNGYVALDAEL